MYVYACGVYNMYDIVCGVCMCVVYSCMCVVYMCRYVCDIICMYIHGIVCVLCMYVCV